MSRLIVRWLVVALAIAIVPLFMASPSAAAGATDPEWGRSYSNVPGDTVFVPVRWKASCDVLGCAESYRVTWTVQQPPAGAPISNRDAVVVAERTVAGPADTGRVASPDFGRVLNVCVNIVAVRRGLLSETARACRTVETPDAPPPAVDSIRWDSLKVQTTASIKDSLGAVVSYFGGYAYRENGTDSLPVTVDARNAITLPDSGLYFQTCAMRPHQHQAVPVVVVPATVSSTASAATYVARCGAAARRLTGATPRFWRDSIVFMPDTTPLPAPQSGRSG
jgi:hypothetical protein